MSDTYVRTITSLLLYPKSTRDPDIEKSAPIARTYEKGDIGAIVRSKVHVHKHGYTYTHREPACHKEHIEISEIRGSGARGL